MRILLRTFLYPANFMMLLGAIYVFVRVAPADRTEVFAMIALTSFGATELVFAVLGIIDGKATRRRILAHVSSGVGALLAGYAVFNQMPVLPFTTGMLLFSVGMILQRSSGQSVA